MTGIQNIKDLVDFIAAMVWGFVRALEDGKFSILQDIVHFLPVAKTIPAAVKDISEVPSEFRDISDEEQAELVLYFKDKFDLPEDKAEELVEKWFRASVYFGDAVQSTFEFASKPAEEPPA